MVVIHPGISTVCHRSNQISNKEHKDHQNWDVEDDNQRIG